MTDGKQVKGSQCPKYQKKEEEKHLRLRQPLPLEAPKAANWKFTSGCLLQLLAISCCYEWMKSLKTVEDTLLDINQKQRSHLHNNQKFQSTIPL